jgi:predicted lipoprotein with Yx(FWY)xxD motif
METLKMVKSLARLSAVTVLFAVSGVWGLAARGQSSPTPGSSLTPLETLSTRTGSSGTYLVNTSGKSLYLFEGDSPDSSACTGPCTTAWPPFTVANGVPPNVAGDAQSALVGVIQRSDGSVQVTYNHHPLYSYRLDILPGDTHGNGNSQFGANWYLVQPNGNALEPNSNPSPVPSSTS